MIENNILDAVQKSTAQQFAYKCGLGKKIADIKQSWLSYYEDQKSISKLEYFRSELLELIDNSKVNGATDIVSAAIAIVSLVEKIFIKCANNISNIADEECLEIENGLTFLDEVEEKWKPDVVSVLQKNSAKKLNCSCTVYLVSENETLSRQISNALIKANLSVICFAHPNSLLENYNFTLPCIIITQLEFSDGAVLDKDIFRLSNIQSSFQPIILYLSDHNSLEDRGKALQLGGSRFFSKPYNIPYIAHSVLGIMSKFSDKPYRVLIVDDDEFSLDLHSQLLENAGCEVRTVVDSRKAINEIISFCPEVIILDLRMPGFSGEDLVKLIRHDDSWANISIMFLSSENNEDRQIEILNFGGDDFLVKPVKLSRFINSVKARAKRARQSIQLNDEMMAALCENQFQIETMEEHDIVSVTDVAGRIISINDKFSKISNYSQKELIGRNHRVLKSGMHSRSFFADMWKTISSGNVWRGAICNKKKDGSLYWVESTIVPFLDKGGKPYKFVSAQTDITALRESEIRLAVSQKFANIGTWDWNIKTGDLFWSDQIGPIFGYNKNVPDTTYENFLASVHPQDRQSVIDSINNCLEYGSKYSIEHRIVWPDASIHWVQETGDVIRDEFGEPSHMLGVVQNIDSRKNAALALAERERLLKDAQYMACLGNWKYHVRSGELIWSEQLYRIFGYEPDSFKPNMFMFHSAVHPEDKEKFRESEHQSKLTGFHDVIYRIVRPDGTHRFVHELGRTERDALGNTVSVTGTIQDITLRVEAEQALITAREEAEKANRAKSRFLSNMSHELRTPLNAIIGFSQILKMDDEKNLSDSQHENIDEIVNAGTHLMELITEVLDLSKIEAGHIELSLESLSVGEIVSESLQLIMPLAKEKNIKFCIYMDGKELGINDLARQHFFVWADKTRVRQALLNLLSNAIKYNKFDGEVRIHCEQKQNNSVRIKVEDTGEGLSESQKTGLFNAFNRLGAEYTNIEGTGIGLVLTKTLVELMGGEIGMSSQLGIGSSFWIDLPDATISNENLSMSNVRENHLNQVDGVIDSKYCVLYIEDNPSNLRLVSRLLGRMPNIKMWSAHEPILGLELAKAHSPDLILLDINLPYINGFEVLRRLKIEENTKNTPVFAISANSMPLDVEKGLQAGFSDYICKPINVLEFMESVTKALSALPAKVRSKRSVNARVGD